MSVLKQFMGKHRDREFLFIAPGGNKGDHLIWAGGRKLADSVGLDYSWMRIGRKVKIPSVDEDVVLYVHGNGGFKEDTPWIFQLLKQLRAENPDNMLVVGPSTVSLDCDFIYDMLSGLGINVFFARDLNSYHFMKELDIVDTVLVDEDEALNLELGDGYLEQVTELPPNCIKRSYHLLSLRDKDVEKTGVKTPFKDYGLVNPEPFYKKNWARWHYEAASITSNRLHSAILGCILGKPSYLVRGRWHKQRSVWEYSLRQRGVKWLKI